MSDPVKPLPEEDLTHVLTHTRELWAETRGQSLFITGGTGFIGLWLLESFIRANDAMSLGMRAVVLTRDRSAFFQRAPHLAARRDVEFLQGDVRTFPFPTGRVAYIIHAATEPDPKLNRDSSEEMLDVIINGTRRVLVFAEQAVVKKLLFISSGAVYGCQSPALAQMDEDFSANMDSSKPDSAYGLGKREAEHLCMVHSERHGYGASIARCYAFVGPRLPLDAGYAIGNFIRDALSGTPIRIKGDGTPLRSYLYAADLAIWLWTILFRGPPGRAYNVGSADSLSITELAGLVQQTLESKAPLEALDTAKPGQPVARYVPAVSRAELELGLKMRIPLGEAIRRTALWHRPSLIRYDQR